MTVKNSVSHMKASICVRDDMISVIRYQCPYFFVTDWDIGVFKSFFFVTSALGMKTKSRLACAAEFPDILPRTYTCAHKSVQAKQPSCNNCHVWLGINATVEDKTCQWVTFQEHSCQI